jgi:ABC-type amino acid transport substrate-binding protein
MKKPKDKGKKEIIKVLVISSDNDSSLTTQILIDEDGNKIPAGYIYDIWSKIKNLIKDKYEFEETFSDPNANNYDNFVKDTASGKYDITIGLFTPSNHRQKLINFTLPLFLSYNVVVHKKDSGTSLRFFRVMKESAYYFLILLIFGIISGILLYMIEPRRSEFFDHISKSKRLPKMNLKFLNLRRTLLTTIAAFFGEMGFLSENSTLSLPGLFIVISIMICSFILTMYMQGKITHIDSVIRDKASITKDDLKNTRLIGPKGYANCKKLERYGAKIKYFENTSMNQLIDKYTNNLDKYDGVCMAWGDGYSMQKNRSDLTLAYESFGQENESYIVNKSKKDLLEDINISILKIKDKEGIKSLCHSYFKNEYVCNMQ